MVGANEQAVMAQIQAAPKADAAPGTVQQAVTLAKILDDENCKALWPTTSRQLHVLLSSLAPTKTKSKGRLAKVATMTNRSPRS